MKTDWRISTFNGVLLACYFIPAWTISALKIWMSPIRGFYDRSNIAVAIYVSDYLNLPAIGTIRAAWLLALAKVTVVAFFFVFLLLTMRVAVRRKGSCDEALAFALGLGAFISMASLIVASKVGEFAAVRLHACDALLLLGATILLVIDTEPKKKTQPSAQAQNADLTVLPQQGYLSSSPSS